MGTKSSDNKRKTTPRHNRSLDDPNLEGAEEGLRLQPFPRRGNPPGQDDSGTGGTRPRLMEEANQRVSESATMRVQQPRRKPAPASDSNHPADTHPRAASKRREQASLFTMAEGQYPTSRQSSWAELKRAELARSVSPRFEMPSPGMRQWFGVDDLTRERGLAFFRNPWVIGVLSVIIIFLFWPNNPASPTNWKPVQNAIQRVETFLNPAAVQPNPPGDYRLRAPPSLTGEQIDSILAGYGSPATGTGQVWVDTGVHYGIDPAFALAFFIHESTAGTHPNWAGQKGNGQTTHNVGNIICAGYHRCHGRFRDYATWEEGINDWFRLIAVEYIEGRGTETVADIIPIYAPAVENDVNAYVRTVERLVDEWRLTYTSVALIHVGEDVRPSGNPLNAPNAVITQGYGIGSHAPAQSWGAIDLALDGNGDGAADPDGTWGRPIYATHAGIITISPNSWPAGNHVWITNEAYRTGYAHLQEFAVSNGQVVQRGDLIGYIGSTGMSSGPHLDYQIWQKQHGVWVNVDPMGFDPLRNL